MTSVDFLRSILNIVTSTELTLAQVNVGYATSLLERLVKAQLVSSTNYG